MKTTQFSHIKRAYSHTIPKSISSRRSLLFSDHHYRVYTTTPLLSLHWGSTQAFRLITFTSRGYTSTLTPSQKLNKRLHNLGNYAANTHMTILVYIKTTKTDFKQLDSCLPLENDLN